MIYFQKEQFDYKCLKPLLQLAYYHSYNGLTFLTKCKVRVKIDCCVYVCYSEKRYFVFRFKRFINSKDELNKQEVYFMKLKISTFLLALTVVAATAGCSNGNTETTASTTPTTTNESTATDSTATTDESTAVTNNENATNEDATTTDTATDSTDKATTDTTTDSTATDISVEKVASAIKAQKIDLISAPDEQNSWVLNDVKATRYVTDKDLNKQETVSIYSFKSADDAKKGLEDLKTQTSKTPYDLLNKSTYTKGNAVVVYWFEPSLNKGSKEKGMLDAQLQKAVDSL